MAKRYHKKPAQSEEKGLGCMRSLINMFDFRQGHLTQKLLPDRKHGSGRHAGISYSRSKLEKLRNAERKTEDDIVVDGKKATSVGLGNTTIKTLIEEEMSKVHSSKKLDSPEIERTNPDSGLGCNLENNHKQTFKNYELASDHHDNASITSVKKYIHSNHASKSDLVLDLAASMVEINSQYQEKQTDFRSKTDSFYALKSADHRKGNHHDKPDAQLTQQHLIPRKTQCDVTKAFRTQKSIIAKQLTGNGDFYPSKEFMDVLESPNLSKDLFLKLHQDPDFPLLEQIQELLNSQAGEFSELESCTSLEGSELLGEDIGISGQCEELVSRKSFCIQNAFFWKDKTKGRKSSKEIGNDNPPTLSRIIVLKPNPEINRNPSTSISLGSSPQSDYCLRHRYEEATKSVALHFSMKEIKRRLRYAIYPSRKDMLLIAMDGILHRIPRGSEDFGDMDRSSRESVGTGLPRKTSCTAEHTEFPSAKGRDRKAKRTECQSNMEYRSSYTKVGNNERLNTETAAHPLYRESFYEKAKKYLHDMLYIGRENENMPTEQNLGRLLSLPEYNFLSPRFSPGRDMEPESPQKKRASHIVQFKQETATDSLSPLKHETCSNRNQNDDTQVLDSIPAPFNTHIHLGKDLILKGSMETTKTADIVCCEERDCLVGHSGINSDQPSFTSERCKEEGSGLLSELGSCKDRTQPVTSGCASTSSRFIPKLEVPEVLMEIPERPSPVSVLEPFFSEDNSSPGSTAIEHAYFNDASATEFSVQQENYIVLLDSSYSEANLRTCLEDKDTKFEYIRNLLEASDLSYDKLSKTRHLSDPLLDAFLFDEVEISSSHLLDYMKLLFDCTNEVLVEIWKRLFGCTPWLSIIRPDMQRIAVGGNLIQEVCKYIDRHLHSCFACTLDQTIRRDLDYGKWMNHRCETESTVFEIGDGILEDIIQETVLESWY